MNAENENSPQPAEAPPTEAPAAGGAQEDAVSPAKVMRIGTMVKQLLEEVRQAPLDEASRARLAEIYRRSITELEDGLSADLVEELERLSLPLADDGTPPTEGELRIAQAQLVGWLEGLFHGIQTVLAAQQMTAGRQLQQMRGTLPGAAAPNASTYTPDPNDADGGPGHYL